jgi:Zn-dependent peptidase ImmA (M78 family)
MTKPTPAEKKADELLERMGVQQLPVPVAKIARDLGAEVQYEAFDGEVSGMLYREQDRTLIGVNSTHGATRQRFTVAHEIAHLLLHKGVYIDRLVRVNWRDGTSDPDEVQANAFAAELLMPRRFMGPEIERVVRHTPQVTPERLVADLAQTFKVSNAAMQFRLANLGVLGPYSESADA